MGNGRGGVAYPECMLPELDAARRGDLELLRSRTLSPPRVDQGWVLRAAIGADRPDVLEALLALGLDLDARATFRAAAIHAKRGERE